tara:strand:+ start:318 stop:722 length:405 start_codon:yes stop_codon:yes gene_type:complete
MILEYLSAFILLNVLDYGYILLNKSKIKKYIASIQLEPTKFKYKYVFITYVLIAYASILFALPKIRDDHIVKDSIIYGLSLGVVIYSISNLHNMSVFKKQNKYLICSDIIIRSISLSIVLYITKRTSVFFKHVI